jgi:hypothetical protein
MDRNGGSLGGDGKGLQVGSVCEEHIQVGLGSGAVFILVVQRAG